jgi:hypothetical protein
MQALFAASFKACAKPRGVDSLDRGYDMLTMNDQSPAPNQADEQRQQAASSSSSPQESDTVAIKREGQATEQHTEPGPAERGDSIARHLQTQTPHPAQTERERQPLPQSPQGQTRHAQADAAQPTSSPSDTKVDEAQRKLAEAQKQLDEAQRAQAEEEARQAEARNKAREQQQEQAEKQKQARQQAEAKKTPAQPQPDNNQHNEEKQAHHYEIHADAHEAAHSHHMPSERDMAKAQLELLSAANRTFLDIVQVEQGNGNEPIIDEGTIEVFERNQLIYEKILDGLQ